MNTIIHTKKITAILLACLLVSTIISVVISTKVKAEIAQEYNSPDLTLVQIDGGQSYHSSFSENNLTKQNAVYTLMTNSAYAWYQSDSIDFAYKQIQFNYKDDDEAVLTAEVTLNSWSALAKTASAGIMIRSSLSPESPMVLVHARPEAMLTVYRMTEKASAAAGKYEVVPQYPVKLRLTLNGKKVTTAYKFTNTDWIQLSKGIIFNWTKDVYIGLAAHTSDEHDFATAVYENFNVKVEANEGYSFNDTASGDDDSSSSSSTEPEIVLPEDPTAMDDVLLRETFTDGSMTNETQYLPQDTVQTRAKKDIINPIWNTTASSTNIETNKDKTDRYLTMDYNSDGYYYAGNNKWTDYSTSLKISWADDLLLERQNQFTLFTRFNVNSMYGYSGYTVTLSKIKDIQMMTLGYINMERQLPSNGYVQILEQKQLNYLDNLGTENLLKVDSFDNHITVYWNNEQVIDFIDELSDYTGQGNRIDVISTGMIGFMATDTYMHIDDIVVKKLYDPVGGDYDNQIAGNWNDPIPDYIKTYSDNKWYY